MKKAFTKNISSGIIKIRTHVRGEGNMKKRIIRYDRIIMVLMAIILPFILFSAFRTPANASVEQEYTQYMVRPGDTLWDIASNLDSKMDIRELIFIIEKINNIDSSDYLQIGQSIQLPQLGTTSK